MRRAIVAGFLGVDKPVGMTSFDIIRGFKSILPPSVKIGHCGTLDPGASGVVVLALGSATRLIPYLPPRPKSYTAEVIFGVRTTSDDSDGDIVRRRPTGPLAAGVLREALDGVVAASTQVPPNVSALHSQGKRRYKLAQEGQFPATAVDARESTGVSGHVISVSESGPHPTAHIGITCPRGTYIRALARDLGIRLQRPAAGREPLVHASALSPSTLQAEAAKLLFSASTAPEGHAVWEYSSRDASEGEFAWRPTELDPASADASLLSLRRIASDGFATSDCAHAVARAGGHALRAVPLAEAQAKVAEACRGGQRLSRESVQALLVPAPQLLGALPTALLYGPALRRLMGGSKVTVPMEAVMTPGERPLERGESVAIGDADGAYVAAMAKVVATPAVVTGDSRPGTPVSMSSLFNTDDTVTLQALVVLEASPR